MSSANPKAESPGVLSEWKQRMMADGHCDFAVIRPVDGETKAFFCTTLEEAVEDWKKIRGCFHAKIFAHKPPMRRGHFIPGHHAMINMKDNRVYAQAKDQNNLAWILGAFPFTRIYTQVSITGTPS